MRIDTPSISDSSTGAKLRIAPHAGPCEIRRHRRRHGRGGRDHADLRLGLRDHRLQLGDAADRLAEGLGAHLRGIRVEGGHDIEPATGEPRVAEERGADLAHADEGEPPAARQAEDILQRTHERGDGIPASALTERAEVTQVLPNLSGGRSRGLREAHAGYDLDTGTLEVAKDAEVEGEAPDRGIGDSSAHALPCERFHKPR